MKKKHLYGAMLWAFLVTANLCTGCSDDNDYPDVDGQNPTMTLATDHIESGAGHRFTIEGTLEDKDGIASISLQCADLHLNKTIDLIEIYGAPQESYDLSYYFDINRNEIGERFTVKVTVTDVGRTQYISRCINHNGRRFCSSGIFNCPGCHCYSINEK